MPLLGKRPPVIASHVRNELHFAGGKAAQVAVHDQVVGVLVMALVVDQVPDVVQQRRSPENVGAGRWQREGVAQRFEQRGPQARHVLAVALVGVTLAREAAHRLHAIRLLGPGSRWGRDARQSEEHTSELQSQSNLVCRLLLEKKKKTTRET